MKTNYFINVKKHSVNLITNGAEIFDNIILCFHGFNGDKWGDVYSGLKSRANKSLVCSFDSCGHGKSEISSEDMRLNLILEEIDMVIKFLKQEFNKPLILVGASYGSYRIMQYLIKYQPQVEKVFYVNPAFRILECLEVLKDFKYLELKDNDKVVMKNSLNKFMKKDFLDDLYLNNLYSMSYNYNYNSEIIVGLKDTLIPLKDTLEISEKYNIPVSYVDDKHCFMNKDNWNIVVDKINNKI